MKKVCFYITTRGNYAKTKTVIDGLKDNQDIELQYIVGGDCPDMEFYGETYPLNIGSGEARSVPLISNGAIFILEMAKPDLLVIVADRFETLPMAIVAHYMGIPIAHLEGGEDSGAIDNKIRHANTQLADLHFPCTEKAKKRIVDTGINKELVFNYGATSFDMLRLNKDNGIEANTPYLLVTFHPGSMAKDILKDQFKNLLWGVSSLGIETYWIRPNIDAGSKLINKELDKVKWEFIHITDSMKIEQYAPLMANASCIVGNSSTGIREASFLGTPVVNVGGRQNTRELPENVINVEAISKDIMTAIVQQIEHGRYEPDYTYGDGYSGEKIAEEIREYLNVA